MKINTRTVYSVLLSLTFTCTSCRASDKFSDGFYVQDETGKSPLKLVIKDSEGTPHQLAVSKYTNVTIRAVLLYSLKPHEAAFQVQMNVVSSDTNWSNILPILVVQDMAYVELTRSASEATSREGPVTIPATISLKVTNESEAKLLVGRLNEKFKIEPQKEAQ